MSALPEENIQSAPVPEITTMRLVLKAPGEGDIPRLVQLANNRTVAESLASMPHPYNEECAREWLAGKSGSRADGHSFGIYLNIPEPAFIGIIGFGAPDDRGQSDLGYWVGEPYWGRGYATEAVRAVLEYGFSLDGITQMLGDCRITNVGSRRVLEKSGFEYRGFARSHCRAIGENVPVDCFAISRPRFRGLQIKRNG
jgi:RimJ/RimL family protein N-acetyltransferase